MKQTKRGIRQDRKIKARYKPAKKFRKGIGNQGDWNRKSANTGKKDPIISEIEDFFN